MRAGVAAEVDHRWIKSSEYAKHEVAESDFEDRLGRGRQATVTATGLANQPDLIYMIRVYSSSPFGQIQVQVRNRSGHNLQVQSLRSVEALGSAILDLHANPAADRVLSDSFSEDWPPLHLQTKPGANGPVLSAFAVDCTGTTEIMATDEESGVREGPKENIIELSLPVNDGANVSSEPLMFTAGSDYHAQLENYGAAIRELHHSRTSDSNMLGWWSWTAFYMNITEGNTLTNVLWQAQHLKDSISCP
jgi:hypothetical protein